MNMVGTYLLYLVICTGLTVLVGTGLARSGRAFLLDVFGGNDTLARAVSRLLVLGFYLLSLGFVTLTMRTGGDVANARSSLQLLSVKIGEVLLVLGVLPLVTLAALARTRRRSQAKGVPPGGAAMTMPPPDGRHGQDDTAPQATPAPAKRTSVTRPVLQ
jgi:hypothetical protein